MKSYREWEEGGKPNSEVPTIKRIATIFKTINGLEGEIESLMQQISKGRGPIEMALDQFKRSFEILQSTIKTAVIKHKENPERADHPPKDIISS